MKKPLTIVFFILGIVFLLVAVYYWVTPAGSLPTYVPGYTVGSNHVHLKHGLAALIVAVCSFVLAWFSLGKKPDSGNKPSETSDS